MTNPWFPVLASVVLVSLISLIGILFVAVNRERLQRLIFVLVSLAVGGLFGDVFLHLLPEAFALREAATRTSLGVLAGIFLFFILDKFLRWRHEHLLHGVGPVQPVGYINLIADGVHNLLDGMMIAAAFQVGPSVGVATTLAVVLHEIPQEIGDFGVLVFAGFSRRRALLFNFFSASLSILGAALVLLLGTRQPSFSTLLIPVTAGGFIYIAGSDLLPELHKELRISRSLVQLLAISAGVLLMLGLRLLGN